MEEKVGKTIIRLVQGDITKEKTDIIVNAANTSLRGGGGVDGAIHRAGGPAILQECVEKYPIGCETGDACITTGGKMAAKWVIHTPGPIWRGGQRKEEELLEKCYQNSLIVAEEYKAKSIAFPSISTGVYGFPIKKASKIAVATIIRNLPKTSLEEVHFVLFSTYDYEIYKKSLRKSKK